MTEQTYLADQIDTADAMAKYDEHAKNLLSDKGVLAYILMYCVEEFKGYTFEEARDAIEGDPVVAKRHVFPCADEKSNKGSDKKPERIQRGKTESTIPGEGKVTFDIIFFAVTKDHEMQKIYVNVEAQKDFYPGYDLVPRGIVYAARLISQQMGTEYTGRNYNGVKKVYSIWICMESPKENKAHEDVSGTITEYLIEPKVLYHDAPDKKVRIGRYDLMSVVFIHLREGDTEKSKNKLIGMLSVLLSSKKFVEDKKKELENSYNLPMTKEMEKEVAVMCNLSKIIEENKVIEIIYKMLDRQYSLEEIAECTEVPLDDVRRIVGVRNAGLAK